MSCMSRDFRITDPRGELLFSANKDQVVVGAETLRVTGVGGAVFKGSVQTPMVRAESGRDLRYAINFSVLYHSTFFKQKVTKVIENHKKL